MTDVGYPEGVRTFRAPSGPFAVGLGVLLALFLLGDAVVRAGWGAMLLLAPWVLLVLWIVYVNSFASSVRIDDDGARVQNLLRRTEFGWSHVTDVDLRWQLTFGLDDGKTLSCFGGPAKAGPIRLPSRGEDKVPPSERALAEIEARWQAASPAADAPIRRSWDWRSLAALAVIAAWAAIAIIATQA